MRGGTGRCLQRTVVGWGAVGECLFVLSVDTSGCIVSVIWEQPPDFVSPCFAWCLLYELTSKGHGTRVSVIVQ